MTDLRTSDAGWFLLISFVRSWGMLTLMVAAPGLTEALGPVGLTLPMFLVAVRAPAIAAIVLVVWRTGREGLVRFAWLLTL